MGKIWADIEYNGKITKLPILITQRDDITPYLGVNWLKQLPITINRISLDEPTNQSENIYTKFNKLFETKHTIKNKVKIQIKSGCYPIQQKARPIPYHLQKDVKNEPDQLIKSGHFERLETSERDCFVSPVVITVKNDKTVKTALDARKLYESCVYKRPHMPNMEDLLNQISAELSKNDHDLDIRDRPRLCIRTNETSIRNQQTLQLRNDMRENQRILPVPKRILRFSRHINNFPREKRQNSGTPNTCLVR